MSLPTPLPLSRGSDVGNDDDVEMTLDALAALTPPTPNFFSEAGDWKWPRSCRTPRDADGNVIMSGTAMGTATGSTSKQVDFAPMEPKAEQTGGKRSDRGKKHEAEEGKRLFKAVIADTGAHEQGPFRNRPSIL